MRLLLLTPQPPWPAHQGTAIRNWGIVRHLAQRHTVSLLSFGASGATSPVAELTTAGHSVDFVPRPARHVGSRLRTMFAGRADLADRLASAQFLQTLQRRLAESHFDLVQVEGLELGRYVGIIRAYAPQTPVVYDAHNAEVTIQRRAWQNDRRVPRRWPAAVYSRLQVPRLAQFETAVCQQAHAVTCVSSIDANALREHLPGLQPVVIANGIDLVDYVVQPRIAPYNPIITFTGKMDYRPNVDAALWFAHDIFPLVRQQRPDASFQVVGQQPDPAIVRLSGQAGVTVIVDVPDIRPHIANCSVYVAPLRMGGGTRFKVLEAMALGRPVVSTTIGAEGFSVQPGRELILADAPAEFANAALRVLGDAQLANQLAQAGRAFVAANYDWAGIIPRLEALHLQLVLNTPRSAA